MCLRIVLCVLLLFVCVSGCAHFKSDAENQLQARIEKEHSNKHDDAPRRIPVKRIVRLISSVIDQPVSEDRVRQAVWRQMCESVLQRPQSRRLLNQNGFRVGVSQPPYPWALNTLLSRSQEQHRRKRFGDGSSAGQIYFPASGEVGTPIIIPEGRDSLLEVRRGSGAEIPIDAAVPGLTGIDAGDQIQCVLRIKSIENGDGWTLLQFLPQLQFGSETIRLTVKNGQEHLPVRQKCVPLFEQQFEIKLRKDDVIVLGYNPCKEWTTGRFFFQSDSLNGSRENLLVLRVSELEDVEGRPSLQVSYRKY